ncbi:MAG: AAA family ATPase, partial [Actinomycetes bacterium]
MRELRGPLVGRDGELTRLRNAVNSVKPGASVVVEVSGAAGTGKTALMDWLASEVETRGFTVVRAAGFRAERDHSFGVLVSALDDVLSTDVSVASLDPYDVSDLAGVLPSLRSRARIPPAVGPVDPLVVCRAVRQAVSTLADGTAGLAVIVDDLHWVDEATMSVLGYLCRHGVNAPMLVAVATRPVNRDGSSSDAQLTGDRFELLELGPIDREAAAQLLQDMRADKRDAVLQAAGGNPFFLTQLAIHSQSRADSAAPGEHEALSAYPPAVTAAILGELAEMSPRTQLLAHSAAVLGDPFEVTQAGQLAKLDDAQTYAAIDDLLGVALVVPIDDHGGFRFRHPIVSKVIYETAGRGWRLDTHARAARLLALDGSDPTDVARHLEHSASIGDEAAIESITQVALGARGLAPSTAARLLGSVLRLLPQGVPLTQRRAWLIDTRADCLIRAGHFAQARGELLAALELVSPQDPTTRASLTASCVRVELWMGLHESATAHLSAALEQLPEGPSIGRMALETFEMVSVVERGDVEHMRNLGQRAATAAATLEFPYVTFTVTAARAFGEARIGSLSEAISLTREAARIVGQLPEGQLPIALEGLLILAVTEHWLGQSESSLRHASLGVEIAHKTGNLMAEMWQRLAAESALTALGRLGSAAETIDDAEQLARMLHRQDVLCAVAGRRSAIAALRGDMVSAEASARECELYLDVARDPLLATVGALAIAPALLHTGRPKRCIELILRCGGARELPAVAEPLRAMFFEVLADAELARDNLDAAREWADLAVSAESRELVMPTCWAQRATARVLIASGE